MSTGPLNSSAPTTAFIIGGVYNVTSPAPTPGQALPLQIDANGNILVNIAAGAASGTQYADGTTQATPTGTVALGKNPSNILHSISLDASGNLNVNIAAGASSGVQFADNAASGATPTGTLSMGWDSVNSKVRALKVDASQDLLVAFPSAQAVTLASTTITGTVVVTQSTSPWVVSLASTTITGTVSVTQGTTPWTIQGNSASGAVKAGNPVQIGGVFNTAQPTVTTGQTVEGQMTARGAQIVAPGIDGFAVSLGSTTITGTVAVTQSTSPWVVNITQLASTALGAPQTFGTAPTGVVVGTSSDIYAAGTLVRSNQTTTAAGVVDVNVVGILGVTNSVTNGLFISITDGTTKAGVIVATTALKTDMSSIAGTATVAAIAGVQKVGISGAAAATLDAVITAATAPANALATLAVNNTTPPSLTTGQSVAAQCDYEGSLFVKPIRRAQTVSKGTAITTIGAQTILAAQAAGIFADISNLIITVAPGATADVAFTVTLSDGTNSYVFNMDTGALATATADPTQININFNPPLPATTAATAWTLNESSAQSINVTVVAVLQKGS